MKGAAQQRVEAGKRVGIGKPGSWGRLPLNAVLGRHWSGGVSMTRTRLFRALVTSVAALLNAGLIALFGWTALHPFGLYGPLKQDHDFGALAVAVFPLANLLAIVVRGSSASSGHRFIKVMRFLNLALVAMALLFGAGSAIELTYSGIERFATLLLLVPPGATALALSTHPLRAEGGSRVRVSALGRAPV